MTPRANRLIARATSEVAPAPLTPAVAFRAYVDAFERLGYDVDSLLADAGGRRADLLDPDALIPSAVCSGFLSTALQRMRPTNLGVRLAEVTPLGAFPLLDYLVVTAERVSDGCRQLSRYLPLLGDPGVDLLDDQSPVRVAFRCQEPLGTEYVVTLAVLHFRAETEGRLHVEYVSFRHQPDDIEHVERVLGCSVRAGQSWAGLALAREAWELPLRRRDSILRGVLERQADEMMAHQPVSNDTSRDVRRVLASRIADGDTRIQSVARALTTSSRSLQRRLAAAGLSYNQLLDHVRKEAAERYLGDSPLSITEIAYLLGYSEPAAFNRAFKRWYGDTPQSFRQRQRARTGTDSDRLSPRAGRVADIRRQDEQP
jgi:AraC-like DNA-binding protein